MTTALVKRISRYLLLAEKFACELWYDKILTVSQVDLALNDSTKLEVSFSPQFIACRHFSTSVVAAIIRSKSLSLYMCIRHNIRI